MSLKIENKKNNRNKNAKEIPSSIEETMFIGSVFCQDVPKISKRTSLRNGTSFGINQFWLGKE